MKLLFRKNKPIRTRRHTGMKCPGFDECIYPGSVRNIKDVAMDLLFERAHLNSDRYCPFQDVRGGSTYCGHGGEYQVSLEWRCYRCGAPVSSETELHCKEPTLGKGRY